MTGMFRARGHGHLLKILGVTFGIAIAVGNVIGSGILRAPSSIALAVPDATWIMALWLIGGVQALLSANIVAELATSVPQSGGPYLYAHRAFGDVAGLIVGWAGFISGLAGIGAASISFAEFLPLIWPAAAGFKLEAAVFLQVLLYATNFLGLREGRVVQEGTSLIKVAALFVFAGAAIMVAGPHQPDAASASGASVSHGWAAIITAYGLILGAYSGWEAPVYFTEENEAPARSVPLALGIGIVVTMLVYLAVNSALLFALGAHGTASTPLPFSIVLDRLGGAVPGVLFAVVAMITVAGTANAIIMKNPRMLFAMARDGLLPGVFQSVNRGGTPDVAMLLMAVGSLALAATGSFSLVFGLIALLDAAGGIIIIAALFALRRKEPELQRPFRALGYPLLPALVLAVNLVLLVLLAGADWKGLAFAAALAIVCVPFAFIARRAKAREAGT